MRFPLLALLGASTAAGEALEAPRPGEEVVTLRAVGDLMVHQIQLDDARGPDGEHRFEHAFSEVRGLLSQADLTYGNLETTLSGPESGYTGYPLFNFNF